MSERIGLVIMRPTEKCNLACRYCYSNESSSVKRMDIKTLEKAIEKILGYYNQITFVWHGGEATLMGIPFFEGVIKLQKKHRRPKQKIINEIQTNATILNKKWIDFFKKNNFFVGISIDGPQYINDLARVDQDGRGTFKQIKKSIELLKKNGIKRAGICVMAKHNINNIDEVIDFYRDNNISLNINPFISSGRGSLNKDKMLITADEFSDAMIKIFDRWYEKSDIKVYDFYKIVRSLFTGSNNVCCYSGRCSSQYISVCPNGDVYPCGRWAGENSFLMGNVVNNSMEQIIRSDAANQMANRGQQLKECMICKWFSVCMGGCPHTAYIETGSINQKDFYCDGKKKLFEHIYKKVSKDIEEAKYRKEVIKSG